MVAGLDELRVQWLAQWDEIDANQWDTLVRAVPGGTPFLRHGVLQAMADSGSACPQTGWTPHVLTLRNAHQQLIGACATYLKDHSWGEYVFDWAWADAWEQAWGEQGRHYHPKLLSAVPFSPIPGPRLLVHPQLTAAQAQGVRQRLLEALREETIARGCSSAHVLFVQEADRLAAQGTPWLVRHGVQFHWHNRPQRPYVDFDDFLQDLHRDKRKKILQERRRVREAGVHFEVRQGHDIEPEDWAFFQRCYAQTYLERGQQPYFTPQFWQIMARDHAAHWVLFTAKRGHQGLACALLAIDPQHGVAYGRYWGSVEAISCLHFEACYYQPLQWCIEHGMQRFEGGAQGEHKLARGLSAVTTESLHWMNEPRMQAAVARFLQREAQGVGEYVQELDERRPFKPLDTAGNDDARMAQHTNDVSGSP